MMNCGNCGSKSLSRVNQKGKLCQWTDYPSIPLLFDFIATECSICGNVSFTHDDLEKRDAACKASVKKIVRKLIEMTLDREQIDQIVLADRLGVSPIYLSSIKNGKKTPAFKLFNLLKILALSEQGYAISDPKLDLSRNFKVQRTEKST